MPHWSKTLFAVVSSELWRALGNAAQPTPDGLPNSSASVADSPAPTPSDSSHILRLQPENVAEIGGNAAGRSVEHDHLTDGLAVGELVHRVVDLVEPDARGDELFDGQAPLAPHLCVLGDVATGYG